MDTNKMREQFEAWALSAKAHGEHFDLSRGNHGAYKSPITHWLYCSWVASWQASHEAVVVELPQGLCMFDMSGGRAPGGLPLIELKQAADAIEAAGLKYEVKP
ncbi:hypothetical protein LG197_17805 [Pseudomonas asiatica]|uniref:hypothetical protein n=1 Tax=Pseudomonas asiatica TaxID=2219225 RepID=UPI0018AA4945|nr:hypothetical protein [Pseudomonas asiatica]MBF8801867.1 hypothetical protein [Pseudomonas asiatica]WDM86473.1 hypothetical protein LG197_17805 [Pseudomonas asiatica]